MSVLQVFIYCNSHLSLSHITVLIQRYQPTLLFNYRLSPRPSRGQSGHPPPLISSGGSQYPSPHNIKKEISHAGGSILHGTSAQQPNRYGVVGLWNFYSLYTRRLTPLTYHCSNTMSSPSANMWYSFSFIEGKEHFSGGSTHRGYTTDTVFAFITVQQNVRIRIRYFWNKVTSIPCCPASFSSLTQAKPTPQLPK